MLGNPIGSAEYRTDKFTGLLQEMSSSLPALTHLHPQASLSLIRYCYNARPTYLARVAEPFHTFHELARVFDIAIDGSIAQLARATPTADIADLRSLPTHLSGLGIPRLGGSRGTVGNLAAHNNTYDFIATNEEIQHLAS